MKFKKNVMKKVRLSSNAPHEFEAVHFEKPSKGASRCAPQRYKSMREIIEGYQRGLMPRGAYQVTWPTADMRFDDVDLEKLQQMDLFDAQNVVKEKQAIWDAASKRLAELRKQEAEAVRVAEEERFEKAADRAREKRLAKSKKVLPSSPPSV